MKHRTMRRNDWSMITKKEYRIKDVEAFGKPAKCSYLKMEEITREVHIDDGKSIVAKDYVWIQLAVQGEYYWMTSMFDDKGNFLEVYIDITNGNDALSEDPSFDDMYLDYILYKDSFEELDMGELIGAYRCRKISKQQFLKTLEVGKKMKAWLRKDKEGIVRFFEDMYKEFAEENNK